MCGWVQCSWGYIYHSFDVCSLYRHGVLSTANDLLHMQVMSGSGDLDVLRMVRRLRLSHSEVCYGSHMAVHMALGLLFIGGGR